MNECSSRLKAGQTACLKKKRLQTHPDKKLFFAATGVRVRASPSPAQLTSHAPAITAEACL
jgi:hypothetical protein